MFSMESLCAWRPASSAQSQDLARPVDEVSKTCGPTCVRFVHVAAKETKNAWLDVFFMGSLCAWRPAASAQSQDLARPADEVSKTCGPTCVRFVYIAARET